MARNADSALKLGQARGSAIVAAVNNDLEVFEYAARLIKQAVVGAGAADKSQVQHMVQQMLKLPAKPQADAADALGVAICHANTNKTLVALAGKQPVQDVGVIVKRKNETYRTVKCILFDMSTRQHL